MPGQSKKGNQPETIFFDFIWNLPCLSRQVLFLLLPSCEIPHPHFLFVNHFCPHLVSLSTFKTVKHRSYGNWYDGNHNFFCSVGAARSQRTRYSGCFNQDSNLTIRPATYLHTEETRPAEYSINNKAVFIIWSQQQNLFHSSGHVDTI